MSRIECLLNLRAPGKESIPDQMMRYAMERSEGGFNVQTDRGYLRLLHSVLRSCLYSHRKEEEELRDLEFDPDGFLPEQMG